jgi:hypothetical protein
MYSGKVAEEGFFEVVDLEFRAGLPIVKAEINGKTGYFLLDTGASNILDKSFVAEMNLKTKAQINVNDSGGNSVLSQPMVNLDNIKIGKVNFKDIGTIIMDLKSSAIFRCVDFDGIIGSNLMRQAYWKIDYQNKKIEFTDNLKNFEISEDYRAIPFVNNFQSIPRVDIKIDSLTIKNVTFDTGSNGKIAVLTGYLKALKKNKSISEFQDTFSVGSGTYGIGGSSKADSTFYAKIKHVQLGEILLEDKIIQFRNESNVIGNDFLSNYDVILDWTSKTIYLKKLNEYNYNTLETFGFELVMRDDGIYICCLYDEEEANEKLKIGDKVLAINDVEFGNMSMDKLCEIFIKRDWTYKKGNKVSLKLERDSEVITVELSKKEIL